MKKSKNHLLAVLILSLFLVFTNCEKEEVFLQNTENNKTNLEIKMFTLSETEIKNDKRLLNKIDKFQTDIKTKNNSPSSSRYIYSTENQFTVNTDYAIHIDNGVNNTYTFPMYRQQDNGLLENLLLVEQEDDSFKVYIVQYEFTEEEIAAINFRESVDFENKVTFIEINDDGLTDDIFGKYFYNGNCYEDNMVHQPGSNCFSNRHNLSDGEYNEATNPGGCRYWNTSNMATSGGYVFMPTLVSCDGQGGNTTGSGPDGNTNNHGGLAGSASTTPITCRVDCLPDSDALESCDLTVPVSLASLSLIDQEICWLNKSGQSIIKANLETYLNNGGDLDFGQEAFDALYNGGQVDYPNKVILDQTVINNQKVKCVYDKLKGLSNTIFNDIIDNQFRSSKNSDLRFKITTPINGGDAFTKGRTNNGINFFEIQLNPSMVANASTIEIALMLIHESIHAELLDRCLQLGIISAFDSNGNPLFTNTPITYTTYDSLFAVLVYNYKNYGGGNSQWNHDLFTVLSYRTKMAQNLLDIHAWLNDVNNDFLSNVNSDPFIIGGTYTLQQLMDYISWIGLEGTQDYQNTINNNTQELYKKVYVESVVRTKYTTICN